MKLVKVGRVGRQMKEVAVQTGANIAACLSAAGIILEANEDVYENHMLQSTGCNALMNAVIIVEPRKEAPLSCALESFLNTLMDEDLLDGYDYENDDCNVDMNALYADNKEMIDKIISKAKEC